MTKQALLCAVALAGAFAAPDVAVAFHNADFATPVSRGGGNGMYFTGSPRYKRLDCTACHALPDGQIGIEISSNPPELFSERRWTPGQTYQLTVSMTGEHLGNPLGTNRFDHNSFVAELNDDGGHLVGSWLSGDPDTFTMDVAGGDSRIVSGYSDDGSTTWTLELVAPPAGTGRTTLYMGAVDGNAAGGGVATVVDPFGDDVFSGGWRFCEGSQPCDTGFFEVTEEDIDDSHESPATGCAVSGSGAGWPMGAALLIMLGSLARRKKIAAAIALAAASAAIAGCLDEGDDPQFDSECPNGVCAYTSEGEPFGDNPLLDRLYFDCEAEPVLQARCSNFVCHGDPDRPLIVYTPNRLRLDAEDSKTVVPTTPLEHRTNFDGAREFARSDTASDSLLLLKPLDTSANGYYHFGESIYYQSDVFDSTADIGYQKLLDWIGGATGTPGCEPTTEVGL